MSFLLSTITDTHTHTERPHEINGYRTQMLHKNFPGYCVLIVMFQSVTATTTTTTAAAQQLKRMENLISIIIK